MQIDMETPRHRIQRVVREEVAIAPLLESQRYDYFWRPTHGKGGPPFYAWFIKRDPRTGARTHLIHMVERTFVEHWDRLLFRDYLMSHPDVAAELEIDNKLVENAIRPVALGRKNHLFAGSHEGANPAPLP